MECEHLNWAETANGRYRFCADCGRDLGAVGDEDPSTLSAGGVSPTAPAEAALAQALFRTLYDAGVSFSSNDLIPRLTATVRAAGYRHMPEAPAPDEREEITDEALWDFANDLLDAWNIEDTNSPSLIEDFRDRFVARFRPSREATTEPQPITDADVEVAAMVLWQDYDSQYGGSDMVQFLDLARAALEAVEASRSPKPTEQTEGSA